MENDEKRVTQGLMECVYSKKFNCRAENDNNQRGALTGPSHSMAAAILPDSTCPALPCPADVAFCADAPYSPCSLFASTARSYFAIPFQPTRE